MSINSFLVSVISGGGSPKNIRLTICGGRRSIDVLQFPLFLFFAQFLSGASSGEQHYHLAARGRR